MAGTVGGDWDEKSTDRWINGCWTHGIGLSEWEGATWPKHGLPCGTHLLAHWVGKMFGLYEV
jgi:hypothetical protein